MRDEHDRAAEILGSWAARGGPAAGRAVEAWLREHAEDGEVLRAGLDVMRRLDAALAPSAPAADEPLPSVLERLGLGGAAGAPPLLRDEGPEAPPPVLAPRSGSEGRYRIVGEIARGGVGVVYKGHDADLGRDVAVKVLREDHAGRRDVLQRFVEEAQIGGQLQHPGIVPVYEIGVGKDRRPFFTMKLVQGRTLAALLAARSDAADGQSRLVSVFEAIAQTVAYAHARGVIHRDLKPANVMVGAFGEVLVVDWGMAKVLRRGGVDDERAAQAARDQAGAVATVRTSGTGSRSVAGSVMGTPAYMAPEQARGEVDALDERADVFALGAILCEILTGAPPYLGTPEEVYRRAASGDVEDALRRLAAAAADEDLVALARSCLAPSPADRPRDAGVVAQATASHLASLESRRRQAEAKAAEATVRAAEERKRRRLAWALASAVVALLLLGGGGFAWVEGGRRDREADLRGKVTAAVDEAMLLRGRAATSGTDPVPWGQAVAAARRAAAIADSPDADPETRRRAQAALADLEAAAATAAATVREDEANRRFVERLDEVRGTVIEGPFDIEGNARRYREVLRDHGFALEEATDREALAARIRASRVSASLLSAFTQWCMWDREREHPTPGLADFLEAVDPDPVRRALRARRLGDDPLPLLDQLDLATAEAETVQFLVFMLIGKGHLERGADLAGQWQARHPGDFAANLQAGHLADSCRPPRPNDALRYLSIAVTLRPRSASAWRSLASCRYDRREDAEALEACGRAIALDPGSAAAHRLHADLLMRRQDLEGAAAAIQEAVRLDPESVHALFCSARLKILRGDSAGAIPLLRDVIARSGRALEGLRSVYHFLLGLALEETGSPQEAIGEYREATRLAPWMDDPWSKLAATLASLGDSRAAEACLEAGLRVAPRKALLYRDLGILLDRRGNTPEAYCAFRESVLRDPKDVKAVHGLIAAMSSLDRGAQARRECDQALQRFPSSALIRNLHGNLLYAAGDLEGAVAAFREAIRLADEGDADADDPGLRETRDVALANLATASCKAGRVEEALPLARELVGRKPDRATVQWTLGLVLRDHGDLAGALEAFRTTVRLQPSMFIALGRFAGLLAATGQVEEAVQAYRDYVTLRPMDGRARGNLAAALDRAGRLAEAGAVYDAAVTLPATFPITHEGRGVLLWKRGDREGALAAFREAARVRAATAGVRMTWREAEQYAAERVDPDVEAVREDLSRALAEAGLDPATFEVLGPAAVPR